MANPKITVAHYLLFRLKEIGVDHIFGVPGDFVLGVLNQVLESDIKYIGTCWRRRWPDSQRRMDWCSSRFTPDDWLP